MNPQLDSRLIQFLIEWAGPFLSESELLEMADILATIAASPIKRFMQGKLSSGLCSNGTPIEFSYTMSPLVEPEFRFSCDTTNPAINQSEQISRHYTLACSLVAMRARKLLDRLFKHHLAHAPLTARFLVWHGAGYRPGKGKISKIYFNCAWMKSHDLQNIWSKLLPSNHASLISAIPLLDRGDIACAGYDFDGEGLTKVKLYTRLPYYSRDLFKDIASDISKSGAQKMVKLLDDVVGDHDPPHRHACGCGVAYSLRSHQYEMKAALHTEGWGLKSMTQIRSVLTPLLQEWESLRSTLLTQKPQTVTPQRSQSVFTEQKIGHNETVDNDLLTIQPTILALGVAQPVDDSETLMHEGAAIYFRPALREELHIK